MPSKRKRSHRLPIKSFEIDFRLKNWFYQMKIAGKKKGTIENYRNAMRIFTGFLKEKDVRRISRKMIQDYRNFVFSVAEYGVRHRELLMVSARIFFRWLAETGVVLSDPAAVLHVKRGNWKNRIPAYLSRQDAAALMEAATIDSAAGLRDRALLETLYSTGMRVKECSMLEVPDIDFVRGVVLIRNGKGEKDRVIPIGKVALHYIDRYIKEVRGPGGDERLFRHLAKPVPLASSAIYELVIRYSKRAGLSVKVYPYLLRHTFAVHLLESGADIRYIQAMLGHERLSTTQIYTQVVPVQLKKVHAASHPAEKEGGVL